MPRSLIRLATSASVTIGVTFFAPAKRSGKSTSRVTEKYLGSATGSPLRERRAGDHLGDFRVAHRGELLVPRLQRGMLMLRPAE